jgi:hypothetical protein
MVNASLPRRKAVNERMVNFGAPDLFLVTNLLNKQFIPAVISSRRAFSWREENQTSYCKINIFFTCDLPLNRTKCRIFSIKWARKCPLNMFWPRVLTMNGPLAAAARRSAALLLLYFL